ncbi:MAG: late competence development ComFB family protein [Lachnospiraceae bacterium]|nr:late competence development ComFB family protein [Lachnospiraceae bacterium]
MARKTNKTSHVLNLITNGEPEIVVDQPEAAPAAPAPAASVPPVAAPAAPVVPAPAPAAPETKVTVVNADKENSAVEEEIQKKLLEALEKEEQEAQKKAEEAARTVPVIEPEPMPVVEPEPVIEAEPIVEEAPVVEPDPVIEPEPVVEEEPVVEPEPVIEPEPVVEEVPAVEPEPVIEPEPVAEPEPPKAPVKESVVQVHQPVMPPEPEDDYHMVNVMETILGRSDILKYMKENGGCICSRCRADVYALVLTRLPSKYVVVDRSATNPMISYYESKYRMRILTEIIKACAEVKENPRH